MISSEKLNQEVEAPISGVLLTKNADVDDQLEVGAPIAVIGEEGEVVETNARTGEPAVVAEKAEAEKAVRRENHQKGKERRSDFYYSIS